MSAPSLNHPAAAVAHLTPAIWNKVNRLLARKALAEFAHEQLFAPQPLGEGSLPGWQRYQLTADSSHCCYRFEAKRMALRHWWIDPQSIQRVLDGEVQQELDALVLINDFKETLGIPTEKLPVYLDEISSTLFGAAYKHSRAHLSSAELAEADYQDFESGMIEGHPSFVANNGRLGFSADDYFAYAPETGSRFAILWLAVHRDNAHFAAVPELDHDRLLTQELGAEQLGAWRDQLAGQGLAPADYLFIPAHPWQWYNKLSLLFAADVANRKIVPLGESTDLYTPQQSIRTYFNVSQPHKCYVKTALSVLNMGFMRGLSPYYMAGTPAINAYLHQLVEADPVLRDQGFRLLRELASIGYHNRYYEAALGDTDSPHKKMFAALWRESPVPYLQPGQRLMTMAALLHVDPQGQALLPELIARSGLSPQIWLKHYLTAFLHPIMHCLYAHSLVFMPHGENLILVLEKHVPRQAFIKDIAEESAIIDPQAKVPEALRRLCFEIPAEQHLLTIFIDIFDGVFRHMAQILEESNCLAEQDFWHAVADSARAYQGAHPELAAKFAQYDLFTANFQHLCLNRLQLKNNLQMVDLADPVGSMIMADPLENPLAPFKASTSE